MFDSMRKAGLPDPQIEDLGTLFKVTFFNRFPQTGRHGLNERQQKVLGYLSQQKSITARKYEELYEVSRPTAVSDLNGLVKKNLLRKAGKGKRTRYIPQAATKL